MRREKASRARASRTVSPPVLNVARWSPLQKKDHAPFGVELSPECGLQEPSHCRETWPTGPKIVDQIPTRADNRPTPDSADSFFFFCPACRFHNGGMPPVERRLWPNLAQEIPPTWKKMLSRWRLTAKKATPATRQFQRVDLWVRTVKLDTTHQVSDAADRAVARDLGATREGWAKFVRATCASLYPTPGF